MTSLAAGMSWAKLPSSLVSHLLSFADRLASVVAAQTACKAWNSAAVTDAVWKKKYQHDFEAESMNQECVAVDGAATSWRRRYKARVAIEQNWTRGIFRGLEIELPFRIHAPDVSTVICSPLARVLCVAELRAHVFDLVAGKLLFSFHPELNRNNDQFQRIAIDYCEPSNVAIAFSSGRISVWNIAGAAPRLVARVDAGFDAPNECFEISLRGEHLLLIDRSQPLSARPLLLWHLPSGKLLRRTVLKRFEVRRLFLMTESSFFAETGSEIGLFAIDFAGEVTRTSFIEIEGPFESRPDTLKSGVLLIFTPYTRVSWTAGERPPELAWLETLPAIADFGFVMLPRLPRHLIHSRTLGSKLVDVHCDRMLPLKPDLNGWSARCQFADFRFLVQLPRFPYPSSQRWIVFDFASTGESDSSVTQRARG